MTEIERKAKAYDEALERYKAKQEYESKEVHKFIEYIFPELAESEDEKIRKSLKDCFEWLRDDARWTDVYGSSFESVFTWLEKQGEQKPDKVEPKFKVDDWIIGRVTDMEPRQIAKITEEGYKTTYGGWIGFSFEEDIRLWTIQEAKNGDVLAVEPIEGYSSSFVAIYKKQNEEDFDSYCFVGFDGKFCEGECGHSTEDIHPATKEQRDLLFQKIHEAGYEWDAEKKELKKIEPFDKYEGLTDFERTLTDICIGWIGEELGWKQYIKDNADVLLKIAIKKFHSVQDAPFEQNLAWSEEDKWMIKDICSAFEKGSSQYIWLKSLKDRVLPQPKQEWNKEDEDILNTIINHFEIDLECTENDDIIRWLKSLSHKLQNKYRTEKPVFKIGDVLTDKDKQVTSKVIDIVNNMYVCDNCSFPVYQQDECQLPPPK